MPKSLNFYYRDGIRKASGKKIGVWRPTVEETCVCTGSCRKDDKRCGRVHHFSACFLKKKTFFFFIQMVVEAIAEIVTDEETGGRREGMRKRNPLNGFNEAYVGNKFQNK